GRASVLPPSTTRFPSRRSSDLRYNRAVMMQNVIAAARREIPKPFSAELEAVNCHHNYVQKETHFGQEVLVTRKGAVSAQKGQLRSEEHTSELQSRENLVCRLLL